MRNQFLVVLFLSTFLLNISAQDNNRIQFGVDMGLNYSTLVGDRSVVLFDDAWKSSFSFGLNFEYFFKNNFGIGIDVNYLNIGSDYIDFYGDGIGDRIEGKVDLKTNIKYINLPLIVKYSILNQILVFKSGIYTSKLISAKLIGNPEGHFDIMYNEDLSKDINNWDFGLTYGVESNLFINKRVILTINASLNNGIRASKMYSDGYANNTYILIKAGIKFNISKFSE